MAILPHIGETALFNTWANATGYEAGNYPAIGPIRTTNRIKFINLCATPVPVFYCPTRRAPRHTQR